MKRIIEKTDDGSATLFVPELNEHYHSTKGARTESQHIFIEMGLKASASTAPRILEVGFGTGLNAWLTLEEAEQSGRHIHYTGLELYPLEWQTVEELGYVRNDEQLLVNGELQPSIELFKQLHTSPWQEDVQLTPHFTLRKMEKDANQLEVESTFNFQFDLVYFDAFAPEKQPEMWSQELFNCLHVLLDEGGILTTYCAKGVVRRMLQTAGFTVERLPGPPGGKRRYYAPEKQETRNKIENHEIERPMKKQLKDIRNLFLGSVCLLLAACAGRPSQTNSNEEKPVITVTLEPQRYFTEAIAGDKFKVVSMVPKGSSPETYDPVPQQLVSLGDSKAYFRIGYIGFEQTWMDRLMNNTPIFRYSILPKESTLS
ncbi:hypothetical protein KUBF_05760 [Bacteroides finegoldii]|nr:hypothetical protein KUBF_05760 [Bacteroides finegoldii]